MAFRKRSGIQGLLENTISNPLMATFMVGFSILILLYLIHLGSANFSPVGYLKYITPFLPPFVITRTARRIALRRGEHDFVKDEGPYIFITYPDEASTEALSRVQPEMISDSAQEHLNIPIDWVMKMEVLPESFFSEPSDRKKIIERFYPIFGSTEISAGFRGIRSSCFPRGLSVPSPTR